MKTKENKMKEKQFVDEKERDKVIETVQKLMALGNRDQNIHEGEVVSALSKAKKFMAKYGLTMAEIEVKEGEDSGILTENSAREGVIRSWEKVLSLVVAEICDVKVILSGGGYSYTARRSCIQFIGFTKDVKAAKIMFDNFQMLVRGMGIKAYNDLHSRNSYLVGLTDRLLSRARIESRKVKDESVQYGALVVVKEQRISEWMKLNVGKLANSSTRGTGVNRDAYAAGKQATGRVDLYNRPKVKNFS